MSNIRTVTHMFKLRNNPTHSDVKNYFFMCFLFRELINLSEQILI
jgi:hypothetical protein